MAPISADALYKAEEDSVTSRSSEEDCTLVRRGTSFAMQELCSIAFRPSCLSETSQGWVLSSTVLLFKCWPLIPKSCLSRPSKVHVQERLELWATKVKPLLDSKSLERYCSLESEQKKRIWGGLLTKLWFGGFAVEIQSSTNFNFGMPTEEKYSTGTEALN